MSTYKIFFCQSGKVLLNNLSIFETVLVMFVFFEKAAKFEETFILLLTTEFVFFVSRYSFEHQSGSQSWRRLELC